MDFHTHGSAAGSESHGRRKSKGPYPYPPQLLNSFFNSLLDMFLNNCFGPGPKVFGPGPKDFTRSVPGVLPECSRSAPGVFPDMFVVDSGTNLLKDVHGLDLLTFCVVDNT